MIPSGTGEQVPSEPGRLQDVQRLVQVVAQQTPSAQKPVPQSEAQLQASPAAFERELLGLHAIPPLPAAPESRPLSAESTAASLRELLPPFPAVPPSVGETLEREHPAARQSAPAQNDTTKMIFPTLILASPPGRFASARDEPWFRPAPASPPCGPYYRHAPTLGDGLEKSTPTSQTRLSLERQGRGSPRRRRRRLAVTQFEHVVLVGFVLAVRGRRLPVALAPLPGRGRELAHRRGNRRHGGALSHSLQGRENGRG